MKLIREYLPLMNEALGSVTRDQAQKAKKTK